MNSLQVEKSSLNLLNLNIQCITNKINTIDLLVNEIKPNFLCLSEHWACKAQIEQINIIGYQQISNYCRQNHAHGGTVIFAKHNIANECKNIKSICELSIDLSFECSAISYSKNTCIICLYRSPNSDINTFLVQLSNLLTRVTNKYKNILICGDFNIDSMNKSLNTLMLEDIVQSYGLSSLFNGPTRVASLGNYLTRSSIDYVLTNIDKENLIYDNFDPGLSDHHAQMVIWRDDTKNITYDNYKTTSQFRKINEFSISEFKKLFTSDTVYTNNFYNTTYANINEAYGSFWEHFRWCFEAAFPIITKMNIINQQHKIKFTSTLTTKLQDLKHLNYLRKLFPSEDINNKYKTTKKTLENDIKNEKQLHYIQKIKQSNNQSKT